MIETKKNPQKNPLLVRLTGNAKAFKSRRYCGCSVVYERRLLSTACRRRSAADFIRAFPSFGLHVSALLGFGRFVSFQHVVILGSCSYFTLLERM